MWKSIHNTHEGDAIPYIDHFPEEAIKHKNSSEMMVELKNGSIYCVMGLDGKNATRARGMNPRFVILSEYAYMDPEAWYTVEPRVSQNKGRAIFLSTPNGQNHFYDLFQTAQGNPDLYYSSLLTIENTNTLDKTHIEKLRLEGIPDDFIDQEYYCSFKRGASGSYYGKYIQELKENGGICDLPIIPDLPCHTAWDIGIGDATAFFIFQSTKEGRYHFIHYYENNGEPLKHYTNYLNEYKQRHQIQWGKHFVPHDMHQREFIAGIDRVKAINDLGYTVHVLPASKVDEGIQSARSILPLCKFNAIECRRGIKCLEFYRKKWNDILKVYCDEPLHDQYSHGADAFRYASVSIKSVGFNEAINMENQAKALRKFWGG